ncbi:ShlB/FhaC/HecB family hemolysin secretion/activation protein [Phaeospirillum tilakii]|uniref:ShlB/FhaC/HecB family hemolysin secretion/activation protein n=1 Tax=Phaeospirillum tilakii TaxID=741673 RepID=A0ABW5CCS7_9PROT
MPFGWWTLSAGRSLSEYLQVIDDNTQLYGRSASWNVTLDRVIDRDATTRTVNDIERLNASFGLNILRKNGVNNFPQALWAGGLNLDLILAHAGI